MQTHAITQGLKRIYYPSVVGRWDDCYMTPPIVVDKNWTALVKGNPTATVITEVAKEEIEETDHKNDTTMAAVRPLGKGRLGVFSISPAYTHRLGYTKDGRDSEINPGVVDGIIIKKGDGAVPSDTGEMVRRLYRWLAANSVANGFGGYKTGCLLYTSPSPRDS